MSVVFNPSEVFTSPRTFNADASARIFSSEIPEKSMDFILLKEFITEERPAGFCIEDKELSALEILERSKMLASDNVEVALPNDSMCFAIVPKDLGFCTVESIGKAVAISERFFAPEDVKEFVASANALMRCASVSSPAVSSTLSFSSFKEDTSASIFFNASFAVADISICKVSIVSAITSPP